MNDSEPAVSGGDPSGASVPTPWGFWATAGLGVAVFVAFLVIQTVVGIPFGIAIMVENPGMSTADVARTLNANSEYIAAALLATGTLGTLVVWLCAWLRRDIPVRDYMALYTPKGRALVLWLAVTVAAVALLQAATVLLGRDTPEFVVDLYANVRLPLLLAIGIGVGAPLFEEAFFRGFLFAGWSRSRLGVSGTILLTSFVWALMHIQYGIYEIAQIFLLGIVLGAARAHTGTLAVPLAMHATINLGAHMQMVYS
ncbi:MAG: CPBP family intramembrane metalloprotease [Pseudomonadales bacterium]|nr:CPBP family intramembrane metalloprotease [Pseudomonadales bacterium]